MPNPPIPYSLKKLIQNTSLYSAIDSRRLAASSKRLDICAAQFAHLLHRLDNVSLDGKVCLEVGSGWVLTHALTCYLLGAKRVIATDITHNAHPGNLRQAIRKSNASLIRDILSPFEDHEKLRSRLDTLLSIRNFDFDTLETLGIVYNAPLDISKEKLDEDIDFIYSLSVLEHIPIEDIELLIENLHNQLACGGIQAHCIHLEDHKAIASNPFGFLAIPVETFDIKMQLDRGNRVRASQWLRAFSQLKNAETQSLYQWSRKNMSLPEKIDATIAHDGDADLKITHIGIAVIKLQS